MILSCDAGGAHRTVSTALQEQLLCLGWKSVRIVDAYDELLTDLDPFVRWTGHNSVSIYNRLVQQKGWSGAFWVVFAFLGMLAIRVRQRAGVSRVAAALGTTAPAALVSVIPLLNDIFAKAASERATPVPFATVVLDIKERPRGAWLQDSSQQIVCFTEEVRDQALAFGILPEMIHRASGPPQLEQYRLDAIASRENLPTTIANNNDGRRVVLMVFGALGCDRMIGYAKALCGHTDLLPIYVCGRNERLAHKLREIVPQGEARVVGFCNDMRELYEMSDLVVSKPGPMTIWEAIAAERPLVLELNRKTLLQERFHAEWVAAKGLGLAFANDDELLSAIRETARDAWRSDYRSAASTFRSCTLSSCAEVIDRIGRLGITLASAN